MHKHTVTKYYIDNKGYIHQDSSPGKLYCDGRALYIQEYPKLFAVIGHMYTPKKDGKDCGCGNGEARSAVLRCPVHGNKDKFNIPDLRRRISTQD